MTIMVKTERGERVAKVSALALVPGWGHRLRRIYKHVYHYVMPAEELGAFVEAAHRLRKKQRVRV